MVAIDGRLLGIDHRSIQKDKNQILLDIRIEDMPGNERLTLIQRFRAQIALATFQLAIKYGYLNINSIQSIADFGAGHGGPTFVLAYIAMLNGGRVYALERSEHRKEELAQVVQPEDIIVGDGIEMLNRHPNSIDLITAFRVAPVDGLVGRLVSSSAQALRPSGQLVVSTSPTDLTNMVKAFQLSGVTPNILNSDLSIHPTIFLGRDHCQSIAISPI